MSMLLGWAWNGYSCCIYPWSRVESVRSHWSWPYGTVALYIRSSGTRHRILLTTLWTKRFPIPNFLNLPFKCSPGRYEGSHTVSCLPQMETFKLYINAVSPNVHINLHTVQKVDGVKEIMVGEQTCKKTLYIRPILNSTVNVQCVYMYKANTMFVKEK